jgi:hypothetical protein
MRAPEQLLALKPPDQDVPVTCAILTYEVGDTVKCALNIHWGGIRGYQGEVTGAIGDTLTMLRLLCAQLHIPFDTVMASGEDMASGEERYVEAMVKVRDSGRDSK